MKKGIFLTALLFAIATLIASSNNLPPVQESRDLTGFSKVSFGVSGNLYINFGKEYKVVLEGASSLLENITTEVTGGNLVIKMKNWRWSNNEKVTINITMPEIKGLTVSGSGRAEIMDLLKTDELRLSVSGSGKVVTTDIIADNMVCSISGSGDIILGGKGKINGADLSISGSGNIRGENAELGIAGISISGSGSCDCNVSESMKVRISGSGNVSYNGSPKIDARISGSGKVRSI